MRRVNVLVSGRVQGVSYRVSCQKEASRLKLTGWVRNLQDGRVEFEAQGPDQEVARLIEWARKGPLFAKVVQVETTEREVIAGDGGFSILR